MTDTRCYDCAYLKIDNEMRRRCYSPQLYKLRTPGILINFERDDEREDGRSHDAGTGKCGAAKLNFKQRIGL